MFKHNVTPVHIRIFHFVHTGTSKVLVELLVQREKLASENSLLQTNIAQLVKYVVAYNITIVYRHSMHVCVCVSVGVGLE